MPRPPRAVVVSQLAALGEGLESRFEQTLSGYQERTAARLTEARAVLSGATWPEGPTAAEFVQQLGQRMVADTEQTAQVQPG